MPANTPYLASWFVSQNATQPRYTQTVPSGVWLDNALELYHATQNEVATGVVDPNVLPSVEAGLASVPAPELDAAADYVDQMNHAGKYANQALPPIPQPTPQPAPIASGSPVAAPVSQVAPAPITISHTDPTGVIATLTVPPSHPQHSTLYNLLASLWGFARPVVVAAGEQALTTELQKAQPK